MRNISATSLAKLQETKGVEPVLIIKIKWKSNGQYYYYSDRTFIEPSIEGKIISFGDIDNVTKVSGSGQVQSINVILDDTNGELKRIIDTVDIHKVDATVLQWFTGISFNDAFTIFSGVVSSPIIWKEGDRTLSFDIVTKLEDNEVGFSPEEGQFPVVPHELIGKAWPLGFGFNYRVPAIQLNKPITGTTVDPIAYPDPTLLRQVANNGLSERNYNQGYQINVINNGIATRSIAAIEDDIELIKSLLSQPLLRNEEVEEKWNSRNNFTESTVSSNSSIVTQPYNISMPNNSIEE